MNGLDNISNKILAEAEDQAKEILAGAERQAAEIAEKSEADAAVSWRRADARSKRAAPIWPRRPGSPLHSSTADCSPPPVRN